MQNWADEVMRGRKRLENDTRSGRPVIAMTEENNEHIHHKMMAGRRLNITQIVYAIIISPVRAGNILLNELGRSFFSLSVIFSDTRLKTHQADHIHGKI